MYNLQQQRTLDNSWQVEELHTRAAVTDDARNACEGGEFIGRHL